jgi:hypothetical protein
MSLANGSKELHTEHDPRFCHVASHGRMTWKEIGRKRQWLNRRAEGLIKPNQDSEYLG